MAVRGEHTGVRVADRMAQPIDPARSCAILHSGECAAGETERLTSRHASGGPFAERTSRITDHDAMAWALLPLS